MTVLLFFVAGIVKSAGSGIAATQFEFKDSILFSDSFSEGSILRNSIVHFEVFGLYSFVSRRTEL